MIQARYYQNKSFWLLMVAIVFLLFAGILISLVQIRRTSNIRTRADTSVPAVAIRDCSVPTDQVAISEEEQDLLDRINEYRRQYGLNELFWSDSLIRASSWKSLDMLSNKSLDHVDSLGRDTGRRLTDCGYVGYTYIGENIDSGSRSSAFTFAAWQHSPVHNATLLNTDYKDAGIALATDSANNSYYWTLDVGAKSEVTPTRVAVSPTAIVTSIIPTFLPTNSVPISTIKPTFGPTPTPVPGFVKNPLDMQLFVSGKIIGIGEGGNRTPEHLTRHVEVSIYNLKNKLVTEGNGFIVYDGQDLFRGIIHFGPVGNDKYFVKIIGDHMLRTLVKPTFQVLDSNRLNILPQVTLVQGDLNDDNAVDIKDYNLALPCFQDKRCQNRDLIDFNDDGVANVVDYNILLHNYWEAQGD